MADDRREQIAKQCDVVAHLASVLATISRDYAEIWREGKMEGMEDLVGYRTAYQMEVLGNMLNGVDAVGEEDAWVNSIFAEAHRLWPRAATDAQSVS